MPSRGFVILTSGAGRIRPILRRRLAATLREPLVAVYEQGQSLPRTLPAVRYAVNIADVGKHSQEAQLQGKLNGARLLRISHKWAVACRQLRESGFVPVDLAAKRTTEPEAASVESTPWTGVAFVMALRYRLPRLTVADLLQVRHLPISTPCRYSTSFFGLVGAWYSAAKEWGGPLVSRKVSLPAYDLERLAGVTRELVAQREVRVPDNADAIVRAVRTLARWVVLTRACGSRPGVLAPTVRGAVWPHDWPLPNCDSNVGEWSLLLHDLPAGGLTTANALALLQEAMRVEWDASGANELTPVVVADEVPATEFPLPPVVWSPTEPFIHAMLRAIPEISLSDYAWLRDQDEVWGARRDALEVYRQAWLAASGLSFTEGRARATDDEKLLEAAYDLIGSLPTPAPGPGVDWTRVILRKLALFIRSRQGDLPEDVESDLFLRWRVALMQLAKRTESTIEVDVVCRALPQLVAEARDLAAFVPAGPLMHTYENAEALASLVLVTFPFRAPVQPEAQSAVTPAAEPVAQEVPSEEAVTTSTSAVAGESPDDVGNDALVSIWPTLRAYMERHSLEEVTIALNGTCTFRGRRAL